MTCLQLVVTPDQGFSTLALLPLWTEQFVVMGLPCVLQDIYRVSGFYPSDTSSFFPVVAIKKCQNLKICQLSLGRQNNSWQRITALDYSSFACFVLLNWSQSPPELPPLHDFWLVLTTRNILHKIWEVERNLNWLWSEIGCRVASSRSPPAHCCWSAGLPCGMVGTGPTAPLVPSRSPLCFLQSHVQSAPLLV